MTTGDFASEPFQVVDLLPLDADHQDIDSLLARTIALADFMLKPPDALDELPPLWTFVHEEAGKVFLIETRWANERQKAIIVHRLGVFARTMGFARYSFMSEIWISRAVINPGNVREFLNRRPKEDPERIDGAMILAADITGRKISKTFQIMQGVDRRRIAELDEQPDGMAGRMFNLLDADASPNPVLDALDGIADTIATARKKKRK